MIDVALIALILMCFVAVIGILVFGWRLDKLSGLPPRLRMSALVLLQSLIFLGASVQGFFFNPATSLQRVLDVDLPGDPARNVALLGAAMVLFGGCALVYHIRMFLQFRWGAAIPKDQIILVRMPFAQIVMGLLFGMIVAGLVSVGRWVT